MVLKQLIHDTKSFYGITDTGGLIWLRDLKGDGTNSPDGFTGWAPNSGHQIGTGWGDGSRIFAGSDLGVIYVIKPNGDLLWYRDTAQDGSNGAAGRSGWDHNSGHKLASGWNVYSHIAAGAQGAIYAINQAGQMIWHKHLNSASPAPGLAPELATAAGKQIGIGWGNVSRLLYSNASPNGAPSLITHAVLYAIRPTGELLWFRDDKQDGSNGPGGGGWAQHSGAQIGTGWNVPLVVSSGSGILYAVKPLGDLHWYRDLHADGTAGWAPNSGAQIGAQWWTTPTYVFSVDSVQVINQKSKTGYADNDFLSLVWTVTDSATKNTTTSSKTLQVGGATFSGQTIGGPFSTDPIPLATGYSLTLALLLTNLGASENDKQFSQAIDLTGKILDVVAPIGGAIISTVVTGDPDLGELIGAAISGAFNTVVTVANSLAGAFGLTGRPNCNGEVFHDTWTYDQANFPASVGVEGTRHYDGPQSNSDCGHAPSTTITFALRQL